MTAGTGSFAACFVCCWSAVAISSPSACSIHESTTAGSAAIASICIASASAASLANVASSSINRRGAELKLAMEADEAAEAAAENEAEAS